MLRLLTREHLSNLSILLLLFTPALSSDLGSKRHCDHIIIVVIPERFWSARCIKGRRDWKRCGNEGYITVQK